MRNSIGHPLPNFIDMCNCIRYPLPNSAGDRLLASDQSGGTHRRRTDQRTERQTAKDNPAKELY